MTRQSIKACDKKGNNFVKRNAPASSQVEIASNAKKSNV
jgi:hypothetical protein